MPSPASRREGAVSVISLAEPGDAHLSLACLRSLARAFEDAGGDPETNAIVVAGPPGTFCSGGDLGDFLRCGDLDELGNVVLRFFRALMQGEKPLIAAVDGAAVGLGVTMLLHFDAVFATPASTFVAPFAHLGLVPEAGSTLLAPARFGYLRAFDLLCLGRVLPAEEAHAIGLISGVTQPGRAVEHALGVATRLARAPREALRTTRRLLRGEHGDLDARIEVEIAHFRRQLEDATTARRLARLTRTGSRQRPAAA